MYDVHFQNTLVLDSKSGSFFQKDLFARNGVIVDRIGANRDPLCTPNGITTTCADGWMFVPLLAMVDGRAVYRQIFFRNT